MVDAMRAMLDELMGKERDVPLPHRSGRSVRFYDPLVCKHEVAGLCPNRLFKNTKSDLGSCGFEIHDDHIDWENIVGEWNQLEDREKLKYGYERDLMKYLDQLIREMDRKIAKAKDRAEKESQPKGVKLEDQARLDEILAKWKEALEKSARLGEEGDVDGSLMFSQQADNFKTQHDTLLKALTQPDRTMTVCDVCGVFINSTDNEQRRQLLQHGISSKVLFNQDHLNGKQYQGWKKIRDKYKELQDKLARPAHVEPEPEPEQERPREREREREHSHHRSRSRDYSRYDERYAREGGRMRERDYYEQERYDRSDYRSAPPPRDAGYYRERDHRRDRERDYQYDDGREHSRRGARY